MSEKIVAVCPCGTEFETYQNLIDQGKGKFCGKPCMYKYRKPAVRYRYTKHVINKGWFKKGIQNWTGLPPATGNVPPNFKGEQCGYDALHDWVARHRGKATICEQCGSDQFVQWANKSHEYKRDLEDWLSLCRKCHVKYDKESGNWGITKKLFENNTGRKRVI